MNYHVPSVMVATEIYFDFENCLFKISLDNNKLVTNEPARNTIWRVKGTLNENAQLLITLTLFMFPFVPTTLAQEL